MNQAAIGAFVATKRRERNLTQEQLAEKLGVSNKTISKWENGRCMPDYSVVQPLCRELGITIAELMDGEEKEHGNIRVFDEQQALDLLERIQRLEQQRQVLYGLMLVVAGIALMALSGLPHESSPVNDFLAGVTTGVASGATIVGVYAVARTFHKQ